ncbi:MAG: hypothetical protein JXX28_06160 [Deltaproteobacteria bacterium]|nr:hypothetical protein [Deltaproteobacteria bacterium]
MDHLSHAAAVEAPGALPRLEASDLWRVREAAETLAAAIVAWRYGVVGACSAFEQTAASVALREVVGRRDPDLTLLIGGPTATGSTGLTRGHVGLR